jgi:protocatechuate 4,5-dioxygenase beta chain
VLVLGTGGLSHQLDGRRAGFINRKFDLHCLDNIAHDPQTLALLSTRDLVAEAGTQGVELVMWLAARGTLRGAVTTVHQHYHVPISNTAAGAVVLQQSV